jgi:leucyl/phenylalanyl-tRNA--protein transferase
MRQGGFAIRYDTAFDRVVRNCAAQKRPGEVGTWITDELSEGFAELHRRGFAHSIETWHGEELVGGLYGVSLGTIFCGESMFYRQPNASKIALVALMCRLKAWSFALLDCQVYSEHMAQLGARLWSRDRFLDTVAHALDRPTRRGPWPPLRDEELNLSIASPPTA